MSQPPQQPYPYEGQPPGYGYPSGPGQHPGGYPQEGGYAQPGGYPQTGPQPAGYGQYGPPGQYGQQPQYGYPGPYGPQGAGPRRARLPWVLAGGGVAVIALVVILILVLTGGSDTSSPRGVAEAAVQSFNSRDESGLGEVLCDKSEADDAFNDFPTGLRAELTDLSEDGEEATATVQLTAEGRTGELRLRMRKQDDGWCISGFGIGVRTGRGSG